MNLSQLLQQRDQTIYLIAGVTALAMLAWRRLPSAGLWLYLRRIALAWLIAVEWLLVLVR